MVYEYSESIHIVHVEQVVIVSNYTHYMYTISSEGGRTHSSQLWVGLPLQFFHANRGSLQHFVLVGKLHGAHIINKVKAHH